MPHAKKPGRPKKRKMSGIGKRKKKSRKKSTVRKLTKFKFPGKKKSIGVTVSKSEAKRIRRAIRAAKKTTDPHIRAKMVIPRSRKRLLMWAKNHNQGDVRGTTI